MAEYIDRQSALDGMRQLPHEYKTKEQRARTGGIAACQVIVKDIPAADVRPVVHGRWDIQACGMDGEDVFCSVCGCGSNLPYWPFCPMCGADMRGVTDG